MHEMHLRQPEFTYSACGLLKKFEERRDSRYILRKPLGIIW